MSLVAYGSSDESEDERLPQSVNCIKDISVSSQQQTFKKTNSETTGLPNDSSNANTDSPSREKSEDGDSKPSTISNIDEAEQLEVNSKTKLFSSLPPPKSRTSIFVVEDVKDNVLNVKDKTVNRNQTVKISVPSLSEFESDVTEPIPKRLKPSIKGSGLFSLLPAPKNLSVKEMKRALVPHVLTKKPSPPEQKVKLSEHSPKQPLDIINYPGSGDESEGEENSTAKSKDFFSLNAEDDSSDLNKYIDISSEINQEANESSLTEVKANKLIEFQSYEEPLKFNSEFNPSPWVARSSMGEATVSQPSMNMMQTNIEISNGANFIPVEEDDLQLDEEALQRLCGSKAKRNQQSVQIIEVSGDAIMPDPKEWLTKQLSQEQEVKIHSHSHRKTDGPTTQQRRKHQITYLAFQAKENELELKNQWSQNRMSRKQTQSKYGF